ncbi:MAG TPA: glycoside hydrolase family 3 N-terminal domain-containing protein [Propionibacteriaceae bacterium]|nr:glycoside hydrolase family 3 N-terminal domain-containing protein [Propionibacteriaceae bacterium]
MAALWHNPTLSAEERADALLAAMTLEEKVGQLGSYWPRQEPETKPETDETVGGEVAPMENAFSGRPGFEVTAKEGLGQLTRVFGSAPIEPADGVQKLAELQQQVIDLNRHGIPAVAHEESLTGFTAYRATVYPAAIAWGATFDPDLIERMARRIGEDMRALGIHQALSPLLDVVRDYRWGRVEETMGEDPYVVGTLGTAYVKGLQSAGIMATLKHFVGYPAGRAGRNHAPVSMGKRELEDVMLPPFEMAVREGEVASVMNSYSDIDGVPPAASVELLTTLLRDRWGFTGTVVSDYWAVAFLHLMHKVADSMAEAGALALTAGMDVELPETGGFYSLAESVRTGRIDESLVDRAARRVLIQKARLGLLDEGWDPAAQGTAVDLDSAQNRKLAREVAEATVVLLDNTGGVLPLSETSRRIAVIGPCADDPLTFMGCYAFPNHVLARYGDLGTGVEVPTLIDAVRSEFADAEVTYEAGVPVLELDPSGIAAAVSAAESADVVVLAVGDRAGMFGTGTSGEGCDAVDLSLPGAQRDLVEAVLQTGTPVVLVVVSGRPYSLGAFASRCAAVVQAFMPGEEGGSAIAGVLSGRLNPSGKLPVGVPNHPGGQPGTYLVAPLSWFSEGISNLDPRPLYPFGHGLSYTSFEVSGLEVSATEVPVDGSVAISATVANTGDRAGAEVVQLYVHDAYASIVRPVKQLVGYAKVHLEPGEQRRVTFDLHADRVSFTGIDYQRIVEPGVIEVSVGTSSEDRPLTAEVTFVGETRVVGEGRVLLTPVTMA